MKKLEKLYKKIDDEELLNIVKDLISIPSHSDTPGHEEEVGQFLTHLFEEEGIPVSLQSVTENRSNVIATLNGSDNGKLMLNGHLDTVPPGDMDKPFQPKIENDRLYGRGSVDMKGAVGAMAYTLLLLNRSSISLPGNLIFTGVIGEESGSPGTSYIVKNGPSAKMAVVGEPTMLQPVVAHKGIDWIEIVIGGKTAHGSIPEKGVNAISKASRVVIELKERLEELFKERSHPLLGSPTANVGVIKGGESPNIVPGECSIQVDRRWLPSQDKEEVIGEIKTILADLEDRISHLDVRSVSRMEQTSNFVHAPLDTDPQHPLTELISEAAEKIGLSHTPAGANYWSDAALLANQSSIPAVVCGPGDIDQAHGADEYIPLDQLTKAVKLYLSASVAACRKQKGEVAT